MEYMFVIQVDRYRIDAEEHTFRYKGGAPCNIATLATALVGGCSYMISPRPSYQVVAGCRAQKKKRVGGAKVVERGK